MNERNRLINNYLRRNNQLRNRGFHAVSAAELNEMFSSLVAFERPDMYAVLPDKVIILEHFEFDASSQTRKGMRGKQEEALLAAKIRASAADGTIHTTCPSYAISLQDWQSNFKNCFDSHYGKIQAYKERVASVLESPNKEFLIGFFIENQISPYIEINREVFELPYIWTKQFAELFSKSTDLDFILFGSYSTGLPELIYVDREGWKDCPGLVDLDSDAVSLSRLNANELVAYGGFSITAEEIENT